MRYYRHILSHKASRPKAAKPCEKCGLGLFPTQEEKWIQRARKGDIDALGRLYERYFEPLYNFVFYRMNENRAMAEDITQYVFLTMVKNFDTFKESRGNFYGWLCGIARHRIADALRFQQKHESLLTREGVVKRRPYGQTRLTMRL